MKQKGKIFYPLHFFTPAGVVPDAWGHRDRPEPDGQLGGQTPGALMPLLPGRVGDADATPGPHPAGPGPQAPPPTCVQGIEERH